MQRTFSSKHFGDIAYEEEKVINFPNGIPGFPDLRRFLLLSGDLPEDPTSVLPLAMVRPNRELFHRPIDAVG